MKIKNLILTFCCLLVLGACKKDSATSIDHISIVGKWYWVEQTYDTYLVSNNARTNHQDYTTTLDANSYFEFGGDGSFKEQPQSRPAGAFYYGHYTIDGDSLFIKRDADTETLHYAVKKLTSSSLVIHRTTISGEYRGESEYTMKR